MENCQYQHFVLVNGLGTKIRADNVNVLLLYITIKVLCMSFLEQVYHIEIKSIAVFSMLYLMNNQNITNCYKEKLPQANFS